ncbi:MAG: SUMF1/EgtB/PvdO family nonheme iron enzyme [Gemmatimonadetes bacterium]|jgi:formylglycine-generating enzyme required for sulfatase activity|nr:SUMF1/EgtB/PvdO family nonheme iron enzyme [Gemmatimonadota bacterium]
MGNKPRLFHDLTLSNEYPTHLRWLPDFFITQTPVINAKYALFKCYRPPAIVSLNQRRAPRTKEQDPVANISWDSAMAFCGMGRCPIPPL